MTILFLLLLAAPTNAEALVKSRPATAVRNERLELKPIDGHHFNTEAPLKCGRKRASEVTPRVFRCRLESSGSIKIVASPTPREPS